MQSMQHLNQGETNKDPQRTGWIKPWKTTLVFN